MLLLEASVNAQVIKPAPEPSMEERISSGNIWGYELKKWWWGYTPTQVQDKVLSEPGWSFARMDESGEVEKTLIANADNGRAKLFFSFLKNGPDKDYLLRRAYAYPIDSPIAVEWDASLKKLPYDADNSCWTDAPTFAVIKRKYASGWVMYQIEASAESPASSATK
jgi:hypothetical protein